MNEELNPEVTSTEGTLTNKKLFTVLGLIFAALVLTIYLFSHNSNKQSDDNVANEFNANLIMDSLNSPTEFDDYGICLANYKIGLILITGENAASDKLLSNALLSMAATMKNNNIGNARYREVLNSLSAEALAGDWSSFDDDKIKLAKLGDTALRSHCKQWSASMNSASETSDSISTSDGVAEFSQSLGLNIDQSDYYRGIQVPNISPQEDSIWSAPYVQLIFYPSASALESDLETFKSDFGTNYTSDWAWTYCENLMVVHASKYSDTVSKTFDKWCTG
jgi:hypothetical protein